MTSTASNAWMPAGRHDVNIGSSLARALKARKGGPVKNGKAKLDREFYSIRYNFKPESVDPTKPGTIEVNKPKDEGGSAQVHIVRPSTQNENGVHFIGGETPQREFDCVLIFDEELGTFTLEKLDSSVAVTHDQRPLHVPRHVNSRTLIPPHLWPWASR
ncbi:RNA polymerase II transcription elongation factor-domain-containing protein [Cubamyces menziesii]|nr:RNA polymerase II transcription elongation factor-domain-containing protein [Cubamyces menziesii]